VNGIAGGEPSLLKTIIPAAAIANVSVRLAPGQRARRIADALEHLLLAALPARCAVETTVLAAADPGSVDPHDPIVRAAADAFERATGTRPVSVREGGTLPVFASLAERGIAPIMTGFTLPEDNIHAPNERFRLDHLPLGVTTAQEMIAAIANAASAAPDGDGAHAVTTPII
jgi:acetylornithine deacetylase/succinyl-diaminopimelate desuccinylase-like protein